MQQSTAPWYLLDFFTRKTGCIDIALEYSLLKITSERLNKEEALLNC